jgi:hypothetical protein
MVIDKKIKSLRWETLFSILSVKINPIAEIENEVTTENVRAFLA